MGSLRDRTLGADRAEIDAWFAVGPVLDDGPGVALTTSTVAVDDLRPGDQVQVYASDAFHAAFTDGSGVAATGTTPGPFPAGVYRWACPDGCSQLVMIQAAGATALGGAFKG